MGFTGFDSSAVRTAVQSVNNSFEGAIRAICNDMQSQFVGGMAAVWACREAQEFFQKNFKPQVDSLIIDINNTFERVTDMMNDGGLQWAIKTGDASQFTKVPFVKKLSKISVDSIRENVNGERGIDRAAALTVVARLNTIKSNALSELTAAKYAVNNSGFLGGSQQAELNGSIDKAKKKIENTIQTVTTSIKNSIQGTTDSYGDTAGKISSIFASMGGVVGAAAAVGIGPAVANAGGFIKDAAANVGGFIKDAAAGVGGFVSDVYNNTPISSAVNSIGGFFGNIGSEVSDKFVSFASDVGADYANDWDYSSCDSVGDYLGATVSGAINTIGSTANTVIDAASTTFESVYGAASDIAGGVVDVVGSGVGAVASGVGAAANWIGDGLSYIGSGISGWFS